MGARAGAQENGEHIFRITLHSSTKQKGGSRSSFRSLESPFDWHSLILILFGVLIDGLCLLTPVSEIMLLSTRMSI
jgi:hypothetical protein